MAGYESKQRGQALRARLDGFLEGEALAGRGVDALRAGLEQACAQVNQARPEASGPDRLNPQHWGYALFVYFRDRIIVRCTILPVTDPNLQRTLLRVDVTTDHPRPLITLSLERSGPASAEWQAAGAKIAPEVFFLDLLERYVGAWGG